VRGSIGHFPSSTTWTPAAFFTRKRQNAIVTARIATQAQKATFRDSAGQGGPKLPFHKSRNRTLALLLAGEERFQLFGNDTVEDSCFGIERSVFKPPYQLLALSVVSPN
jgi:hypothetical protein